MSPVHAKRVDVLEKKLADAGVHGAMQLGLFDVGELPQNVPRHVASVRWPA